MRDLSALPTLKEFSDLATDLPEAADIGPSEVDAVVSENGDRTE